jgi:hypothetical protein
VPDSSSGKFTADIMIMLTDGSVLINNGYITALGNANQWLRLTPSHHGRYETGSWSSQLDMKFARQWFTSVFYAMDASSASVVRIRRPDQIRRLGRTAVRCGR